MLFDKISLFFLFENKIQRSQKTILRIQKGTQNDNDDNNDKAKEKKKIEELWRWCTKGERKGER